MSPHAISAEARYALTVIYFTGEFIGDAGDEPALSTPATRSCSAAQAPQRPPSTRGTRRVLVVEFWEGEERACGHDA